MEDLRNVVDHYAGELTGSRAVDAFHRLLELGPVALPYIAAALRLTRDSTVKLVRHAIKQRLVDE